MTSPCVASRRTQTDDPFGGGEYNAQMEKVQHFLSDWDPAVLIMGVIFALSAQPAGQLPNFGSLDYIIKKTGHVLGYGVLAVAYWRGLDWEPRRLWEAWLLALLFAATDEFHQAFVPGRHASVVDVLLFDGTGSAVALLVISRLRARSLHP